MTTVIVPTVTGGDYFISGLNLGTGASASAGFRVIEQVALNVQVSVGTLHFRGEVAEFYVLVTGQGTMRAATIETNLWGPSGTSQALVATEVAVGLYKATYTLPGNAATGTYALVAQASVSETYLTGSGSGLATFLVSPTLTGQNNALLSIQNDIGQVRTDTATISTSIGTLTANLAALDTKISSINGNVATVQTSLGTVTATLESLNGKITTIQGDVATIKTNAGTANQQLSALQSSGGLLAMSSASVAAILSAVAAVFALAAWRAARRPKP